MYVLKMQTFEPIDFTSPFILSFFDLDFCLENVYNGEISSNVL